MIPLPLPSLLKYGGVVAFVILVYAFGHHQGAKAIRTDWDASKAKILAEQQAVLLSHMEAMDAARKGQEETNIKVSEDHERALNAIHEKYDADIVAVRRAGGLRVPRTICNPAAAASETTSTSRIDEAATIQLPTSIEKDLYELTYSCDETALQLKSLQKWIIVSGLYPKDER